MSIGFPGSSARKESACNEGEPSLIPVSGRFTGEGNPPPGIHAPQDPRILPGRSVKKSQRRGDLNAAQVSTTKVSPSPDSFGPRARR